MRVSTTNPASWASTWSRRSRLRSGTHLLPSAFNSEKTLGNSTGGSRLEKLDVNSIKVKLENDHVDVNNKQVLENFRFHGKSCFEFGNIHMDSDDDDDPEYKQFLKHLRSDGKAYVVELVVDGSLTSIKFEKEDDGGSIDVIQSIPKRSLDDVSSKLRSCSGRKKLKSGGSGLNSTKHVHSESVFVGQIKVEGPLIDEDYQIFLDHVREYGDMMVLEMGNNVIVRYEEGMKNNGEKYEELVRKDDDIAVGSGLNSSKKGLRLSMGLNSLHGACEDDIPSGTFEDRLNYILKKPFDHNEYEELLKLATLRAPVVKHRQLRNRSCPYKTKDMGLAYLDHHPELTKQIQCADSSDRLKLLRGFFFWLKNICHKGAYKPWVSKPSKRPTVFNNASDGTDFVLPLPIEMPMS